MDKVGFLNLFKSDDENMIVKLWEDIELAESIDYFIETDIFYPPNIWNTLSKININGMRFLMCGLTTVSEKKNIIIIPPNYKGDMPEPRLVFFKIDGSNRFKNLEHKDFLGTIMSLGIKREILGDIIVKDSVAFGVITEEKFEIIEGIQKVSNIPVKIFKVSKDEVSQSEFENFLITIPSKRLDSIVGEISKSSRQKASSLIEEGNVLVNYNVQKSKSFEIKNGDVITIKRVGKFIFENTLGENKKGKLKVLLKKFI